MRKSALEFVLYLGASALALLLDVGLLRLLVDFAGWPYLPAAATSFISGGVLLYFLCVNGVFRFRRVANPALELPLFVALGLVGLLVNIAVIYVMVEAAHVHYLVAKGFAAGCTFATNFLLRRTLMFSRLAQGPFLELNEPKNGT